MRLGLGHSKRPPASSRSDFEALLGPVLPMAFRYAVRLSKDRDVGLDLVQDASLSAFRSFHLFVPGTNFKAWFLKILLNHFYRTKERESRHASVPLVEAPESYLYIQARKLGLPMAGDPVETMLGRADYEMVSASLGRLPSEYQEVAILHFITEMSYAECSETLDVPIGTIRSRLHRARRLLQVSLWEIAEERGYFPTQESI